MVSVAYYRAEAERCRALARETNDPAPPSAGPESRMTMRTSQSR